MIGTREPPTFSNSHRYGSGFHGSPVVTNVRSDERSATGSPCGSSARTSVGERPERRDALLLHRRARGGPASASRARPRRRRSSPPSAPTPTTVHGPMIQPMSVAKCMHVALVHVGLVGDFARDRDEEAALHVHDALRLCRSCRRCRSGDTGARSRPRAAAASPGPVVELERREHDLRVRAGDAHRLLEDLEHRHGSPRRDESRRVITTFASLASSRWATAGAAKPEKTGTCTAPMCAIAFEATATSGDIGRKIATRSPGSTPRADELLREARHVARELGEREGAARAVLAEPDGRGALGRRSAQRCTQLRAMESSPADEPRRPLRPARVVEHRVPRLRELEPEVVDAERPEPLRLVLRAATSSS